MNYGQLKTAVQEYLENAEISFVANLPLFIRLAEEDIYRSVNLTSTRKTDTGLLTASTATTTVPDDFLAAFSIRIDDGALSYLLLYKEPQFLDEAYPDTTYEGLPRYFTVVDHATLRLAPTPDENYPYTMYYYGQPQSLTLEADGTTEADDTASNWLSENGQNALLFGTLLQGYIYSKGDADVIAAYKDRYDKALADLKAIAEGRNRKDTHRRPDIRLPV